jgi:hypothetical protein
MHSVGARSGVTLVPPAVSPSCSGVRVTSTPIANRQGRSVAVMRRSHAVLPHLAALLVALSWGPRLCAIDCP